MIQILSDVSVDTELPIYVADTSYKSCIGCLSCWLKTPGKCILGGDINAQIIHSDHLIIISQSTFGSYSSLVKRVIDRTIPLVQPSFENIHGQLHHKKRYKKYPSLHVIYYGSSPSEEALVKRMVKAHSVNLHAPSHFVHFCHKSDLQTMLNQVIGGLND